MASEWALLPGAKAVSRDSHHYQMTKFEKDSQGMEEFVTFLSGRMPKPVDEEAVLKYLTGISQKYHSKAATETGELTGAKDLRGEETTSEGLMHQDPANKTKTGRNPDPINTNGLCLLSLDGGGIWGLPTLYILKTIMTHLNNNRGQAQPPKPPVKPCDIFDLIGGTGIGGSV